MLEWCSAGCEKCFEVSGCLFVFGFVAKHQCVKSDAGSYRSQRRECNNGVVWENIERLKTSRAAVSSISYRGRPARSKLQ